ncbi:ABC transporter permease [Ancylomarina sp. DW003]|nr:ABC transporter permease [Ancylomarina sp. DW003]MDE5423175.1 ABC transporter permease [Ancylomarina sp. DW003]
MIINISRMNILYQLRMAIKSLRKNLRSTLFLMVSLCSGLVAFIFITSHVISEFSYDKNFPESENIYRIATDIYSSGELKLSIPECERGLGNELQRILPEVIESGFFFDSNKTEYKIEEHVFSEENVLHASAGILDIFSIELIYGSRAGMLQRPYTVLLSESFAKKYFGNENPVGKKILKYPAHNYEVEGVYKDLPQNIHFKANMLLSFHDNMRLPPPVMEQWGESSFYTYLKFQPDASIDGFNEKMNQLVLKHKGNTFKRGNIQHLYNLQPLTDIHLKSHLKAELANNTKADYLYVLIVIGLLILIAIGFNYVHFSHTKAIKDANNWGLRKVVGAKKESLIFQSLLESFILHIVSLILALIISTMLIPFFQKQFGVRLNLTDTNLFFWILLSCMLLLSTIINGVITGILINRYNCLELLKFNPLSSGFSIQKIFVVGQFVIVIAILIGIIGINKQLKFLQEKDMGMNLSNKIAVTVPKNARKSSRRFKNFKLFEQELLRHPNVESISQCNTIPGELLSYNFTFKERGTEKAGIAALMVTDVNYLSNFNISLLGGDNFPENANSTNSGCIINEACLSELGYSDPKEAIGKVMELQDNSMRQSFALEIKGVCSNFNFQNLKENPGSTILINWTQEMMWGYYIIKFKHSDITSVIAHTKNVVEATFPNYPFRYVTLESFYNHQFIKEFQLIKMLYAFVYLAILISIINLFTMSWIGALVRTKEIGIRKINGAKTHEIIKMLNRDFLKWVAIAFIIACPIAYYVIDKWLENFAYKTELSWWVFVLAGLIAMCIALLTVSVQSWRAATRNPVESLRYE